MRKKQLISILMIELIILLPIAIADSLNISNVRSEDITDVSARIKWETNNPKKSQITKMTTLLTCSNRKLMSIKRPR